MSCKQILAICVIAAYLLLFCSVGFAMSHEDAQISCIVTLFGKYKIENAKATEYAKYIIRAAEKYKQDPFVIAAMIVHESSVRNNAKSKGGDYGLMQVRWKVHKDVICKKYSNIKTDTDMFDPEKNILIGTEIFSGYRERSGGDVKKALLRYSAGNKPLANKIFFTLTSLQENYKRLYKKGKR